jgi:hypothetical protein
MYMFAQHTRLIILFVQLRVHKLMIEEQSVAYEETIGTGRRGGRKSLVFKQGPRTRQSVGGCAVWNCNCVGTAARTPTGMFVVVLLWASESSEGESDLLKGILASGRQIKIDDQVIAASKQNYLAEPSRIKAPCRASACQGSLS